MKTLRSLRALVVLAVAACADSVAPVAPSSRIAPTNPASAALVTVNDPLGSVVAKVTSPDIVGPDRTLNYSLELSAGPIVPPQSEIVFVMDASGSVTSSGWSAEKAAVVDAISTKLPANTYVGIVQFSDASITKYTFSQNQTRTAIYSTIQALPYLNGATATLAGMQSAEQIFATTTKHLPRLVVLVTDGNPNPPDTQNPCSTSNTAAKTLRQKLTDENISTIVVGVGPDINANTLACLFNFDSRRFTAASSFADAGDALAAALDQFYSVKDAEMIAELPEGVTLNAPISAPNGTTATVSGGLLQWVAPTLSGQSYTLNVSLKVPASACGTITPLKKLNMGYAVRDTFSLHSFDDRTYALGSCDASAPVIAPTVTGTKGDGDWYTSDITVHWNVSDAESAITSSNGCGDTGITVNTDGTTFTCTATSAGGTNTQSVTIKRDGFAPSITPIVSGTTGNNGWYVGDVSVSFDIGYGISGAGAATGCAPSSITTDGEQTITCTAKSGAGLPASKQVTVRRDVTKPVIAISGNAGTYSIDQTVAITCGATDAASGIASSTCANLYAPASSFTLGANTRTVQATDNAGNSVSTSYSFTVVVTTSAMYQLIDRMVTGDGKGILTDRMRNIEDKLKKKSPALDEQVKNFLKELDRAQKAGQVSAADAAMLVRVLNALVSA